MRKEESHDSTSSCEDGTMMELEKRDFSISIPEHKQVEEKGGFPLYRSTFYTVFVVQTQSKLPAYSDKKHHIVERRYSDFEHLLNHLQSNVEY